jgi:transposase
VQRLRTAFLCADGLAALVRETLRLDPLPGMVFVFRAKPADHVDESSRNKTE